MPVCKRCCKCCFYVIPNKEGKLVIKKCKHLRRNFHLHTGICRVYNKRKLLRNTHGMSIDTYKDSEGNKQHVFCVWRENSQFNYKGCDFNVKGREDFADYCERNNLRFDEWKK